MLLLPLVRAVGGSENLVAVRHSKNPSNDFGDGKMRFMFGVDLMQAVLLQ
jgi:hypothetical protein